MYWTSEEGPIRNTEKHFHDKTQYYIIQWFFFIVVIVIFCLCLLVPMACMCLDYRKKKMQMKKLLDVHEKEKLPSTRLGSDGLIIPSIVYKKNASVIKNPKDLTLDMYQTTPTLSLNVPSDPLYSCYHPTEVITHLWYDDHQMGDMYSYRTYIRSVMEPL